MTKEEYLDWLRQESRYAVVVDKGDGRWVGILRLMFHWTMHEGRIGDMEGYDRRYCYQTFGSAADALSNWMMKNFEGEPDGWHRDPFTGRRRPDGDAGREYVAD